MLRCLRMPRYIFCDEAQLLIISSANMKAEASAVDRSNVYTSFFVSSAKADYQILVI